MTVRGFSYLDSSAPTIDNAVGDLTNLLDKILVTGYPTQSITSITRSGSTATATKASHGYSNGNIISISGAVEDEYNGNVQIFNVSTDTFDYTVSGTPSSPATGTILASNGKTSLGWQLVFTGTNKRVYRAREGNRHYFRLAHDTLAYLGRIRGYETMSDVDTGTGPFPTDAQFSGGLAMQATENSGTNHPWYAYGDERCFHVNVRSHASSSQWNNVFFGDLITFKPSDPYSTLIIGRAVVGTSGANDTGPGLQNAINQATTGHYMPRSHSGLGGSVQMGKMSDGQTRHISTQMGQGTPGTTLLTFPCPVDGGLHLSRLFINEPGQGLRGMLRGLWNVCHNRNSMTGVTDKDIFVGSGPLDSKTFEFHHLSSSGCGAYEISDTWEPYPT